MRSKEPGMDRRIMREKRVTHAAQPRQTSTDFVE